MFDNSEVCDGPTIVSFILDSNNGLPVRLQAVKTLVPYPDDDHDEIDLCITVDGEAIALLAAKFQTCDADIMFFRMTERFKKYGRDSYSELERFLKNKGIEFSASCI